MPVYNGGAYLNDAIESISRQTFRDFEFIAVDDGSTDGSSDVLDRAADQDPRLVVVRQANQGITTTLNAGLSKAKGEFIARMDGDDVSHPSRLEKQLAYMLEHPACAAVGCWIVMIDPKGNVLCEQKWPTEHDAINAALLAGRNDGGLPHPTALIRHSSLDAIGGYRPKFPVAQDKDLWLRLAEVGKLSNLPEFLLKYRVHPQSTGATRGGAQRTAFDNAIAEARQRRGMDAPPPAAQTTSQRQSMVSNPNPKASLAFYALDGGNYCYALRTALAILREKPFLLSSYMLLGFAILLPFVRIILGRRRRTGFHPW